MKRIHTYESFLNENSENIDGELSKYMTTLKEYSEGRREDREVYQRALELIDEIKAKPENNSLFYKWLSKGSTLELQELLRSTTYKGGGNAPEELRDFNAFALLDAVSAHNKNPKWKEDLKYAKLWTDEEKFPKNIP